MVGVSDAINGLKFASSVLYNYIQRLHHDSISLCRSGIRGFDENAEVVETKPVLPGGTQLSRVLFELLIDESARATVVIRTQFLQ